MTSLSINSLVIYINCHLHHFLFLWLPAPDTTGHREPLPARNASSAELRAAKGLQRPRPTHTCLPWVSLPHGALPSHSALGALLSAVPDLCTRCPSGPRRSSPFLPLVPSSSSGLSLVALPRGGVLGAPG